MAVDTTEVLDVDTTTLAEDEAIIERGVFSFVDVGEALFRIKEGRKYVDAGFDSFAAYCSERWGMTGRWGEQHIAGVRVRTIVRAHGLPDLPNLETTKPLVKLMNEAGRYDPSTKRLRNPEAAEKAVLAAMTKVVKAKERQPSPTPITSSDVAKAIRRPANTGGEPGWFELIGTVGDDLERTRKHLMTAVEKIVAGVEKRDEPPSEKFISQVGAYVARADEIASMLRRLGELGSDA